ncbi:MAG TPA: hypothetical protein VGH28_26910 [Polyangiaceae bacterium]|jgi:hypothetical protein
MTTTEEIRHVHRMLGILRERLAEAADEIAEAAGHTVADEDGVFPDVVAMTHKETELLMHTASAQATIANVRACLRDLEEQTFAVLNASALEATAVAS